MTAAGAVRLLGGELQGRTVRVPPGARPSSGRLREALFSIWSPRLPGARVLDLFAGSGAVGLEALSRGAERAVFAECAAAAVTALRENIHGLVLSARCRIVRCDVVAGSPRLLAAFAAERFDLIFADPPYGFGKWEPLLAVAESLLAAGGELAVEHSRRGALPDQAGGLCRRLQRSYGESSLSFFGRPVEDTDGRAGDPVSG